MAKKITTEIFKERAQKLFPNYDYSKSVYVNAKTKVIIICPEHGEFLVTPDNHLHKHIGCPLCSNKKTSISRTSNIDKFIEKAQKVHNNKYDYSKFVYIDAHTKGIIICPEHGEFEQNANNHLSGKGCPKCRNKKFTKPLEEYIKSFNLVHQNFYDYSKVLEIKNNNSYITIICPIHGEFKQLVRAHQEGRGCPHCSKSKGELMVSNILKQLNYNYSEQMIINNSYNNHKFIVDFFIKEYNTIIEYNGEQHYMPIEHFGGEIALLKQQQRDANLRNYCQDSHINLIEIKYDCSYEQIFNLLKSIRDYE